VAVAVEEVGHSALDRTVGLGMVEAVVAAEDLPRTHLQPARSHGQRGLPLPLALHLFTLEENKKASMPEQGLH